MLYVLIIALLVGEVMLANQIGNISKSHNIELILFRQKKAEEDINDLRLGQAEIYNRLGITKRFSKESRDEIRKVGRKVDKLMKKI